ncbi:usherin-like isoform X1 [Saccostrea cucullata]|uniref:usherin-like isoform X1 n=1 Tax=Saccostrea cuccullata TaxID=36930 RepID=UPI002ED46DF0
MVYRGQAGIATVTCREKIPQRTWIHLAIQVYKTSLSFYINGVQPGFLPVDTLVLASQVKDSVQGQSRIGQSITGANQFLGRLQDVKFFAETLTNREIQEVYSGSLPSVRLQSECRCQASHPRIKPQMEHYCIANGVDDADNNAVLRLNAEAHNLEFLNDGDSNTYWISQFQNHIELTINLEDDFQVFFLNLQFYSPLPRAVLISRELEGSWEEWQMYATDCQEYFSQTDDGPLPKPDSVNCLKFKRDKENTHYSKGNITFSLLAAEPVQRPGKDDFYGTPKLKEFVRASKVRVKLQDHQLVTNLRHEYFGVFEFIIKGRCNCHGHAYTCDSITRPYNCSCLPESFTQGNKCEECQPLYNNKPYRDGDLVNSFDCKPCECHNHSDSCVYNATLDLFPDDHDLGGGGVCVNCQHFTSGQFCETCVPLYYRPRGRSKYDPDVCVPCLCSEAGVEGGELDCKKDGGQCQCKANTGGRQCDLCLPGFFNLLTSNPDGCENCSCNTDGTLNGDVSCDTKTGTCNCKQNTRGAKCADCEHGYFNLTAGNPAGCSPCECNPQGSTSQFCDPVTGQCQCKDHVTGRKCDQCTDNYQNFELGCKVCTCNSLGTVPGTVCDKRTGQCVCKENVQGLACDECKDGSFGFGGSATKGCYGCICNLAGTINSSLVCDKNSGKCVCKENVVGTSCNQCSGNTFGLSVNITEGCEPCNCDPTGTKGGNSSHPDDLSCDQNTGECTCLANRIGRRCDDCAQGYFTRLEPGGGCQQCGCHYASTYEQTSCDSLTGQCQCRQSNTGITGRTCEECQEGFYGFNSRLGTCSPCECEVAGSLNSTCDIITGKCFCKQFVEGRRCDACISGASYISSENPYGCSKEPAQQPPPEHQQNSSTVLWLTWKEPDYPNGVIKEYRLFRNGTLIFTGNSSNIIYEDSGLSPYTRYTYIVEATNDFGSVHSSPVTFRTLPGPPTGIVYVTVKEIQARTAQLAWIFPAKLNGPLANFSVVTLKPSQPTLRELHWTGLDNKTTITGLVPFTNYTVFVVSCSEGGCLDSWPVVFSTKSALPTGMEAPVVTMVSSSKLNVTWKPPAQANGIIIFYELWMRGSLKVDGTRDPQEKRIFHPSGQYNPRPTRSPQEIALPPPDTNFLVQGLEPYAVYEFQVLAENDIGKTASPWVSQRTGEATPIFTPAPTVYSVSHSQLELRWESPSEDQARGVIMTYRVYFFSRNDLAADPFAPQYLWKLVSVSGGASRSHMIGGLDAYQNYTFKLGACNSEGCVNSSEVTGTTQEDVPAGLFKPKFYSVNSSMIRLSWPEPADPNGPAPLYSVEKTVPSLSFPPLVVQGTRFPGGGYYLFPPEIIPPNVAFTGIRFKFKMDKNMRNGLLIFAASAGRQDEFLAIQFKSGRPWFVFDPQDCPSYVEISPYTDNDRTYNDDTWHSLVAIRDNELSRIEIDQYKGTKKSSCTMGTVIGPSTGVYIGGLPTDFVIRRTETDSRLKITRESFQGCIKDIQILQQMYPKEVWKTLDWGQAKANEQTFLNWEGCPVNLDKGYHFMGQGYVSMPSEKWRINNKFNLAFHFRTDLASGILFFTHEGEGMYYFVALIENSLYFEFSNGIATGGVTFQRPEVKFCDGNWYQVEIKKIGQQASIAVHGYGNETRGNSSHPLRVAVAGDVYIGGVPEASDARHFIERNKLNIPLEGFGGCIYNIVLTWFSPVYYNFELNVQEELKNLENVNLDGCTPFNLPEDTCKHDIVGNVYNGTEREFIDTELQPYSDYLYRVLASNDAGTGASPWVYGKTKEGAPIGVRPPYNVRVLSGFEISASWYSPQSSAGLLSQYILRAHNIDKPQEPPVEAVFTDTGVYSGKITTAIPYTNYTVKIAICTGGGCTESSEGVKVTTSEEAPGEVPAPTAETGTSYLLVRWKPPGMPNGIVTGYFLYKDGVEVYSGGGYFYNITGLQVYTGYQVTLRACTRAGCTDGPTTMLSTAQLPPSYMEAPTLVVLGNTRVEARWTEPTQLNGVLQRYLLYVSEDNSSVGEIAYNNSDFFMDYIIPDLVAGTQYFIRVGACTLGGCTLSKPSTVTTEESAPERVPDPEISSPSPHSLLITWDLPGLPNGHIISYHLYHNEVKVYSGLTRSYTIENLAPYSLQAVRVSACTVRGCGSSELVKGRTMEAPPTGYIVMNSEVKDARTIKVYWNAPAEANGVMYYDIYAEGEFYADKDSDNYTLVRERRSLFHGRNVSEWIEVYPLIPLSQFVIQVNASNTAGFLLSNTLTMDMPPGTPDGVLSPDLVSETPTSMKVTWQPVGRTNSYEQPQYILQFRDLINNGTTIYDIFGPTTTFLHTKQNLVPYTPYEFRVVAKNTHGDTKSSWSKQTTRQDKPRNIDPPLITSIGSRYVDIVWQPPLVPNGVVMEYRVFQNDHLMAVVDGMTTKRRMDVLRPFSSYIFTVEACTSGGCQKSSSSATVRTLEDVPEDLAPPELLSLTPTSVQVDWEPPGNPNGLISHYQIERRVNGTSNITVVTKILPDAKPQFVDDMSELSPFTVYDYRVIVVNGAGTLSSEWNTTITKSSKPTGVMPPDITVNSPTSLTLTWDKPVRANGILEYYVIRLNKEQHEIRNISIQSLRVDTLQPYTNYSVTLTVCSDGGCTESATFSVQTQATIPEGQNPPIPTPISQNLITVTWENPQRANGPNIHFELMRKMLRQPLEETVINPSWLSIYSGTSRYFEDRGLSLFTTYIYKVTVYNSVGQLTSRDSVEATTYGGFPRQAAVINVLPMNHVSLQVTWVTPDVVELQGSVTEFILKAYSERHNVTEFYDPGTSSVLVKNLHPNTLYTVYLTITIHGGQSITSNPMSAETLDGAPLGMAAPQVFVVSDTILRVTWSEPATPNGEVTGYYIYLNDRRFNTNSAKAGSYILTDLLPYTIFRIQMEVCTTFACTQSPEIRVTTRESLPQGVVPPKVVPLSPTEVNITWIEPTKPNGIVLRYDLNRRTIVPCSLIPPSTVYPEHTKCTYLECSIHQKICGSVCFSGPKVCCDGVIHTSKPDFECCGKSYLYKPSVDAVCCGDKFHTPVNNYTCCGSRYVEVLPDHTCCEDDNEDRVSVGLGNLCCGDIPYLNNSAQMCCDGELHAALDQVCCGGQVYDGHVICCGDHVTGSAYQMQSGMMCCGQDYVLTNRSLCCTSDTGHQQAFVYGSALEKTAANEVCCGLNKISKGLGCCNYQGYNPYTHVCADFSSMQNGCGMGKTCNMADSNTSFCDRCNFDKNSLICGSWTGSHVTSTQVAEPSGDCVLSEETVFSGLNDTFIDTNLQPFSVYEYILEVVNSAGGTASSVVKTRTLAAAPSGVVPPAATVDPSQIYVIYLTWDMPKKPNGEITHFILYRDGLELYRGLDFEFTDDKAILPYQSYVYKLTVCNVAGCTDSQGVMIATAEGVPERMDPPVLLQIQSESVEVSWKPPSKPNGIITNYILHVSDGRAIRTMQLSITLRDMKPYTNYSVHVEVCTRVGCTSSKEVSFQTLHALPEGVLPPRIVALTTSSVLIFWDPPQSINGLLKFYSVMRISFRGAKNVYFGKGLSSTDSGLVPGSTYSYYLIVGTSEGNTSSAIKSVSMPTNIPDNIPALKTVTVQSSSWIFIEWDPIVTSSGTIDQYGVILNAGQPTEIEKRVGLNFSTIVTGLKPHFEYDVRLVACLAGEPNACGIGAGTKVKTEEAPPSDMQPPILTPKGPNMVDIEWAPPLFPNGDIIQYLIYYRKLGSLIEFLINRVEPEILQITHAGNDLKPYSRYQYKVVAGNKKGDASSGWALVRTLEAPPTGLKRPDISATSAYGFMIQWSPPTYPNGVILEYRVVYKEIKISPGNHTVEHLSISPDIFKTLVSGLKPYSNYEVHLQVLNKVGNASSETVIVQTDQSSPVGMPVVKAEKISSGTALILSWDPPAKPNGVISIYRLYELGSLVALFQGINREFEMRRLQPFTMYTVQLEACTKTGCTKGVFQNFLTAEAAPTNQPTPKPLEVNATSAMISWARPLEPNGVILMYEVLRREERRLTKRELSNPVVVYSTNDTLSSSFTYTDVGLRPYTEYQYSVRSTNAISSVQSPWQTVFTEQALPQGVASPTVKHIPDVIDSLMITWTPPSEANGVIQSYQLQRNDSVPLSFDKSDKFEYVDTNLLPYSFYSYKVIVCTAGGCTTSTPTIIRTVESPPVKVEPPHLESVSSSAIKATWEPLSQESGQVTKYQLTMDGSSVYSGLNTEHTQSGLTPYKLYSFSLTVCTRGGCTESGEVSGRPLDDVPTSLQKPTLNVLSSQSIEVMWKAPLNPHGIITSYDVRRDGALIYTQSLSISGNLVTTFTDYGLSPGTSYSYVVIARNRKGSVESPAAIATTYSSSPAGLSPPVLKPLSSTSIQASWNQPAKPNGQIQNYTLLLDGQIVYTGGAIVLSYTVPGLLFWTEYTFRVQACTNRGCELSEGSKARTLEAVPEEQPFPSVLALADDNGGHAGVLVTWDPPLKPNGVIIQYKVYRRKPVTEIIGMSYTDRVSVYNGTKTRTSDFNTVPFTTYQYMVMSLNSVGGTESEWASVSTKEAPPTGLSPPVIQSKTPKAITVQLSPPTNPNGVVIMYSVIMNGTVRSSGNTLVHTVGQTNSLLPFTWYSLQGRACTQGGCTDTQAILVQTEAAIPVGQDPALVSFANSTTLKLTWNYPREPNGEIIKFILKQRSSCPLTWQPFTTSCVLGEEVRVHEGLVLERTVSGLHPYTAYDFQVLSFNSAGRVEDASWTRAETLQTNPVYIRYPHNSRNGSQLYIDWTDSFELNGKLREFVLVVNDLVAFHGVGFSSFLDEETSRKDIKFSITVVTEVGQAASPAIEIQSPETIARITQTGTTSEEFYEEVWFMALMIVMGLILLLVTVVLCMRCVLSSRPYIRERSPLRKRRGKPREGYSDEDTSSGSVFGTEMSRQLYGRRGHNNPAHSYEFDFTSSSASPNYDEDDDDGDDFINDDNFFWKRTLDSGLFDDMMSQGPSYSYSKTQSAFTDTHV